MNTDNDFDLDSQLEHDLQWHVGQLSGPSPRVSQSAYEAAFLKASRPGFRSSLASAVSSKAAVGLAVAALAVGGGSLAAAAATGSSDPGVWGKTVTAAVDQCTDLSNGISGIGDCVSKVAKQKGAEARADRPRGNSAQDHPTGPPTGTPASRGNGNGRANGNAGGNGNATPGGPPSSTPSGPKETRPTGPPATPPGHSK